MKNGNYSSEILRADWRGGWLFVVALLTGGGILYGSGPQPGDRNPGVIYTHQVVKEVPWSIHIVKVDRHQKGLRLLAGMGQGTELGVAVISDQIRSFPAEAGKPLAAINGDFFYNTPTKKGDPEGVQIFRGELISGPLSSRSCIWIDRVGTPHMTNVSSGFMVTWPDGSTSRFGLNEERDTDTVVLYTSAVGESTRCYYGLELVVEVATNSCSLPLRAGKTFTGRVRQVNAAGNSPLTKNTVVLSIGPSIAARYRSIQTNAPIRFTTMTIPDLTEAETAIGGGPALVRNGKPLRFSTFATRHPRSAVGWNQDYYYFIEVDGRQEDSIGMSFPELATYMSELGCTDALNLDGGGSATLWVYGSVVNSPSQGHERPSANCLVVVQDPQPTVASDRKP